MMNASSRDLLAVPAVCLAMAPAWTPQAAALDAHVHGESTLEMVIEAGQVQATLRGPAANFYGFERAPQTPEEEAAVAATRSTMEAPDQLLVWDAEAGCQLVTTEVSIPEMADSHHDDHHEEDHDEHHDGHHADDEHEHEGDHADHHSEVSAQWTWECSESVAPGQVAFRIHDAFPATETVALTLLAADGNVIVHELSRDGERLR